MFDWSQLLTPAVVIGTGTWLGKLASGLLNHKSTENFEAQTAALTSVIEKGNAELKGSIEGGNKALVTAIEGLAPKSNASAGS